MPDVYWRHYAEGMKEKYQELSYKVTHCLVNIMTVTSHDGVSFEYGNIFLLVKFGFYTTVWWKFLPGCPEMFPEELLPVSIEQFLDECSHARGYNHMILQETKDLTQTVVSAFQNDHPFNDMFGTIPETENPHKRKWLLSMGLGIMISFCLSVGVLPDINEIILY